jgi:probable rRNA maturation factor
LEIDVTYAARRPGAPRPGQFKAWAAGVVAAQPLPGGRSHQHMPSHQHKRSQQPVRSQQPARSIRLVLSIRVVGAARSRALNSRYRGKDRPTNVLSFSGAGPGPAGAHHLGELVICAPVVAREAMAQNKSREAHWAHMTVHGMLHLLGFDHELAKQARKMAAVEVQILDRLGFSNPYA